MFPVKITALAHGGMLPWLYIMDLVTKLGYPTFPLFLMLFIALFNDVHYKQLQII